MPNYRRISSKVATVFFTVVCHRRRPIFGEGWAVELLRQAFREEQARRPFVIDAAVILPDHLHCIWRMPIDDDRYGIRWGKIKARFTGLYLASGGREARPSRSRRVRSERGVWQRRFRDRVIRDDNEYGRLVDYIH